MNQYWQDIFNNSQNFKFKTMRVITIRERGITTIFRIEYISTFVIYYIEIK